jgi:hypothetical protein
MKFWDFGIKVQGDSMKTPKMKDKKNIIESKIFPETLKKI